MRTVPNKLGDLGLAPPDGTDDAFRSIWHQDDSLPKSRAVASIGWRLALKGGIKTLYDRYLPASSQGFHNFQDIERYACH